MLFCVCFRSCQYNLLESSLFFFSYKKVIPLRNINIDISCQLKMKEFFRWVKSKSLILKSKFIMQCEKKWDMEQLKLPKKQRRPCPSKPEEYERIISGELKGKDYQTAMDQYNLQAKSILKKSLSIFI